jgi:hypothetical protein
MTGDGEYVPDMGAWLRCPECGCETVHVDAGWDGEYKLTCDDCQAWGYDLP